MRRLFLLPTIAVLGLLASSCSGGGGGGGLPENPRTEFGGARPVTVDAPSTYDRDTPIPLLLVLHGYGVTADIQVAYLGATALVESAGVLLAAPEGTANGSGDQFWNATDACCGFGAGPDDVKYLRDLIAEIKTQYNVDPKRVFVFGHSNGGFMAHRLACDASPDIAAVISLAGATWLNAASCAPSEPVSVLQIHGDIDDTIFYAGGTVSPGVPDYPGAVDSVQHWQTYDGCAAGLVLGAPIDVESAILDSETKVESYGACPAGRGVELWTIQGGGHVPTFTADFMGRAWAWLAAHPKP